MQLTKLLVFYLVLVTKTCWGGIMIETSKPDKSGLVEATINILETCYKDRMGTVGLAGVSSGNICETLPIGDTDIPVTLIDETSRVVNNGPISPESRHKLQVFVVTVTDTSTLAKNLKQIKNSKWWNHMASIFLLDWPESNHGCFNVYEMLWETWKMNLLNSKLICLHQTRGKLIYTYNPYTNKAPLPWRVESAYKRKNYHIWTLFAQVYRQGLEICEALDFDKTTDLGGYEIRAFVNQLETSWSADHHTSHILDQRLYNVPDHLVTTSFNATWTFLSRSEKDFRSDLPKNPYVLVEEIVNGSCDINFDIRPQYSGIFYTTTYPFVESGLVFMTQYRGHLSQLGKILSVLDRSSRFLVLLVLLITLLFFKCYLRKPLITAVLNLVLVVCNAALPTISNKLPARIYLGCLFAVVLTIQGIYQGQLASLLTKQVPLPNIDTIGDLARSNHTIYGQRIYYPSFNNSVFDGRYHIIDAKNCTGHVLSDPEAACVNDKLMLVREAAEFNLHLSHEMVTTIYVVYAIRSDWPLENRVNTVLRRCLEGDLIESQYLRKVHSTMRRLKLYEYDYQDKRVKIIAYEELSFAFVILGIGLAVATLSFIVEIGISRSGIPNNN